MPIAIAELARRLQARADWLDESRCAKSSLEHLALPKLASPQALSFLSDPQCAGEVSQAGAVLVEARFSELVPRPLVVDSLPLALARARQWLPILSINRSIQPIPTAKVHPSAVIGPQVVVGDCVSIGANAVIEGEVRIGSYTNIGSNVTIVGPVRIGNRVRIDANTSIGAEPFMYIEDKDKWVRFPRFAGIQIYDGVEIGAGVTVDHGLTANTVIQWDVKIDNQVHLGHGVNVGRDTIIAARATVAGEAQIGERCKIGGACALGEGVYVADDVVLAGMTAVSRSLREAGEYASVWPAQSRQAWWRQLARLRSLAR